MVEALETKSNSRSWTELRGGHNLNWRRLVQLWRAHGQLKIEIMYQLKAGATLGQGLFLLNEFFTWFIRDETSFV